MSAPNSAWRCLSAGRANLLVLDEPTNNLDPASVEAVGEMLSTWPGTVVAVSHDRPFVDALRPTHALHLPEERYELWRRGIPRGRRDAMRLSDRDGTQVRPTEQGGEMTDVTDLTTAQAEIQAAGGAIGAEQWGLPTPCTNWSVEKLVVHMIEGSRMTVALLHGASADESRSVFGVAHGPDLAAELDAALADELAAFGVPGAFEMVVHHPAAGDVPGVDALSIPDRRLPAAQLGRRPSDRG